MYMYINIYKYVRKKYNDVCINVRKKYSYVIEITLIIAFSDDVYLNKLRRKVL
jgi:hypothetical protein